MITDNLKDRPLFPVQTRERFGTVHEPCKLVITEQCLQRSPGSLGVIVSQVVKRRSNVSETEIGTGH